MLPLQSRRTEAVAPPWPLVRPSAWILLRPSARATAVAGLALFWVVLRFAASHQPGYDLNRDTISALASDGATHAWIGIAAVALAGLGTLLMSRSIGRLTPPGALSLAVAGFAIMVVAASRISCADGAAGCEMADATSPLVGQIHMTATVLYQVAFLAAVGCVALAHVRRGGRALPIIAVLGMLLSVVFFASAPLGVGVGQRMWLLVHSGLIVGPLLATRE